MEKKPHLLNTSNIVTIMVVEKYLSRELTAGKQPIIIILEKMEKLNTMFGAGRIKHP